MSQSIFLISNSYESDRATLTQFAKLGMRLQQVVYRSASIATVWMKLLNYCGKRGLSVLALDWTNFVRIIVHAFSFVSFISIQGGVPSKCIVVICLFKSD